MWRKRAKLFSGGWSDVASDFHGLYYRYAHLDIRRLAHIPIRNFLAFFFSGRCISHVYALWLFSPAGDLHGHWVSTITAIGLRLRQWKSFPISASRRQGLHSESLVFPGSVPRAHTAPSCVFFTGGGGFSWFMTRSCVWDGFIRLARLGRDTMNVLMSPMLPRLVLFGMCMCVVTGCGRHAAREP